MGLSGSEENLGLAFAVCTAAGLSTAVGAALVYVHCLVAVANKLVLASALSISAGVMLYVSFVEIFQKSLAGFEEAGVSGTASSGLVYASATLCFFGGILLMTILHKVVHCLGGGPHKNDDLVHLHFRQQQTSGANLGQPKQADKLVDSDAGGDLELAAADKPVESKSVGLVGVGDSAPQDGGQLQRMGVMTALAIGIHNFPEGLATFVATLADPSVGVALAIAIGIHNIPEGLCVSIPVYYATGSRLRGILWALLSGITEPLGALLGYLVLKDHLGPMAYGIVFGFVGGMMVFICVHELIPTAHRYDPHDKVASTSLYIGMGIMALSLVLFVLEPESEDAATAALNSTSTSG